MERKAREQRAAEKAKKDDARNREREEREAREKEMKERKAQDENEKKEREMKARADREVKEREKAAAQPTLQPPTIKKRPSQASVAVPPALQKQSSAISSPHPSIAIPAIPKAPTPARPRQTSQQGSLASSPKQTQSQTSTVPSKSSSPGIASAPQQQQAQNIAPQRTVMQKAGNQQSAPHAPQMNQTTSPPHQQPMHAPPGMTHPQYPLPGFNGMPPVAYGQFQGPQGQMMHNHMGQRSPMPMYPQHGGPPMGMPTNRFGLPGMNGILHSSPGMMQPQGRGMGFPFDAPGSGQPPPGFGPQQPAFQPNHTAPIGQPPMSALSHEAPHPSLSTHSRHQSASDKDAFQTLANQPIARPAPIQRPSSVKPQNRSPTEVDDLSKHLGSSALLDDTDEPMPANLENRRTSTLANASRNGQPGGMAPLGGAFGGPAPGFGSSAPGWNPPGMSSFGQPPGLAQPSWGAPMSTPSLGSSWVNNNAAFASNGAFGPLGGATLTRPAGGARTLRLAVCQACKQLTAGQQGEGDGFHGVDVLLRQIKTTTPHIDSPLIPSEVENILDTEGDSQNGGGMLHVRRDGPNPENFSVKWAPDAATPDQGRGGVNGLGEIGSPMPTRASPSSGFGAPGMGRGFQSLGKVGAPGPVG